MQQFHQQRNPRSLPREDQSAGRLKLALAGHFRVADRFIQFCGGIALTGGEQALGAQDAAVGHLGPSGGRGSRQSGNQRRRRGLATNPPQGVGGRADHQRIGRLELGHQRGHRFRIAEDAQRVDRADEQVSLKRVQRRPQGIRRSRIGNRLQRDPRPGRELRVGQQRGERGDGVLVAVNRQAFAGDRLFGRRRVRFQNVDHFARRYGGGRGGQRSRHQKCDKSGFHVVMWLGSMVRFHSRQGSRRASERRRLACSSPMNSFFTGSKVTLRPRNSAMLEAWQAMCA